MARKPYSHIWTEAEDALMREKWPTEGYEGIRGIIDVTLGSATAHARHMGLVKVVRSEPTHQRGHLVDIHKASEITGLSKAHIHRHITNATLPFSYYLAGPGKRLFDIRELNAWMQSIKVPPGCFPGEKEAPMKK